MYQMMWGQYYLHPSIWAALPLPSDFSGCEMWGITLENLGAFLLPVPQAVSW